MLASRSGVIIQLLAIVSYGHATTAAIASLVTSALTTGFVSATMSFDWDTDPKKRIENPQFYGYIPNRAVKRAVVFFVMLLTSSTMLVVRAMTLLLLSLASWKSAVLYTCLDLGLYMFWKIYRNDFSVWMPIYGCTGIFISFIMRLIVKVLADFTSNIHLRNPNEVGGAYWLFSFAFSLVSLPLAIMYYEGNNGSENITRIAWTACYVLLPLTLALKFTFFAVINKKYRKTFWSLKRGRDVTVGHMDSNEDSVKALVFIKNRYHWIGIQDKVEKWVRENWMRWIEEEPEWLNDNMKARIPSYMIPNIDDRAKIEDFQRQRRRSSIMSVGPEGERRMSILDLLETYPTERRRRSTSHLSFGKKRRRRSTKKRIKKIAPEDQPIEQLSTRVASVGDFGV